MIGKCGGVCGEWREKRCGVGNEIDVHVEGWKCEVCESNFCCYLQMFTVNYTMVIVHLIQNEPHNAILLSAKQTWQYIYYPSMVFSGVELTQHCN